MSTLGPSQLFKPNDGDRKKEETEGSGGRVGKTRDKKTERQRERREGKGRERNGGSESVRQLSSLLRFPGYRLLPVRRGVSLCLFPNAASITGLETRSH